MTKSSLKWLALCGGLTLGAGSIACAQDSGALLDALVRKGILNDQEAEDIRADLTRDFATSNIFASASGKSVTRIAISGRIQAQYDNISADNSGAVTADPAATSHFLLRRVYLGAKANLGSDFTGTLVYDFSGARFDAAMIEWSRQDMTVGAGLRKVDFGFEERTSSTRLKAIERSGVTRYFVEDNNGRRLGAGAHRVGVFYTDKVGDFFYGAAVTNAERASTAALASGTGGTGNNNLAYWANVGYKHKVNETTNYTVGAGLGLLPDQGGFSNARSAAGVNTISGPVAGNDLMVASVYGDVTFGKFSLSAEYMVSDNENGGFRRNTVNNTTLLGNQDAKSWGYYIQPTYMITDKLEAVLRYSHLDSDGRGVAVSDGIRNSPNSISSNSPFDTLTDYYLGLNYYFKGADVKLSLGYVWGKGEDTLGGVAQSETDVSGFRSQMQVLF